MFDLSRHLLRVPANELTLVVLFGGSPTEHNVSRASGAGIYFAAKNLFKNVELIGIKKDGSWIFSKDSTSRQNGKGDDHKGGIDKKNDKKTGGLKTALDGGLKIEGEEVDAEETFRDLKSRYGEKLVVFPALHGPGGEDGSIQALLEKHGIAYVGSDSQASKNCMNKITAKKILEQAGMPVVPYMELSKNLTQNPRENLTENWLAENWGADWKPPLILKPANLGSSMGVTLIQKMEDLEPALEEIGDLDDQFLVEPYIKGREMECAVVESAYKEDSGFLSAPPGEIVSTYEIYRLLSQACLCQGSLLSCQVRV